MGAPRPTDGVTCHLVARRHLPRYCQCLHLSRTGEAWAFPFVCRAHDIYTADGIDAPVAVRTIQSHTPVVQQGECLSGHISLELYLLHAHFVMAYITPYHLGYWPTVLLTLVAAIPLAWLLHQLVKRIMPV